MSISKQIQPVQILDNTATQLSCYVIKYDGIECILYWWLSDNDNNKLYDGNYKLPDNIISNWGIDDSIIIQSLATDNNFQLIEENG